MLHAQALGLQLAGAVQLLVYRATQGMHSGVRLMAACCRVGATWEVPALAAGILARFVLHELEQSESMRPIAIRTGSFLTFEAQAIGRTRSDYSGSPPVCSFSENSLRTEALVRVVHLRRRCRRHSRNC